MKKGKQKRKKVKKSLPTNRLLVFRNPDKDWHEKWTRERIKDSCNIPHPSRVIIVSEPNQGKGNIAKNLLLHQDPPYKRLVIITEDIGTKEFDELEGEIIDTIPEKDFFDRDQKTLVIVDDVDFVNKNNRKTNHRLNRLFGNWSTHLNISVILCTQSFFDVPPIVRRCCNMVILGKNKDNASKKTIAKKIGVNPELLNALYNKYVRKQYDMIWFDLTKNTPFPIRQNGFTIIDGIL